MDLQRFQKSRRGVRRGVLAGAMAVSLTVAALIGVGSASSATASGATSAASALIDCAPVDGRVKKGSHLAEPNELSVGQAVSAERRVAAKMRTRKLSSSKLSILPRVTIPVVAHVITKKDGTGTVSRTQLRKQIAVLNAAYGGKTARAAASTLFRFKLVDVNYVKNNDWYDWSYPDPGADTDDVEAKTALHQGGLETLNMYITGLGDGLLGYATFPFDGTPVAEDGVVLLNDSLPGGTAEPYNLGDTATHEVGHWLGLYHTFQDGCAYPGDQVRDTPYQADGDNVFSCEQTLDTCTQPGKDPVHNFMSYGDDYCLNRFSPGQSLRMALVWYAFRSPYTVGGSGLS